jgi:hypothetical protein
MRLSQIRYAASSSPTSECQRRGREGLSKADGPQRSKRRATGTGWVRETRDHDYADAQRRGHPVTLPWTLLSYKQRVLFFSPLHGGVIALAGPERHGSHSRPGHTSVHSDRGPRAWGSGAYARCVEQQQTVAPSVLLGYVRGEGLSFPRPPPINSLCNSRLCRPRLRPLR